MSLQNRINLFDDGAGLFAYVDAMLCAIANLTDSGELLVLDGQY